MQFLSFMPHAGGISHPHLSFSSSCYQETLYNMRTFKQFPMYSIQAIRVLVLYFFQSARKGAISP
jgi:hypothetical protein